MLLSNGDIITINENINIFDIKKIYKEYQKQYKFLYDCETEENVAGYQEALEFYDNEHETLLHDENFKKYMFALCTLKQDGFTSDREIVALMFAFSDFGVFQD